MKDLKKYIKIWLILSSREAQVQLLTNWAGLLFIIGKVVRFLLFFAFLFSVLSSLESLVGYTREQVILFFLVFTLIDSMIQFIFRGIYSFRFRVVSGEYDLDLSKPWPSFLRPVLGSADILDFITLVPLWIFFLWYIFHHQLLSGGGWLVLFLLLLLNSMMIGFAFHLFICSVALITLKIDHLVWVYRDLTSMARFPTDIYQKGIQYILTFTIPVVILITIPAKALLGILTWPWVALSFIIGGALLWGSWRFWRYALTRYGSASS